MLRRESPIHALADVPPIYELAFMSKTTSPVDSDGGVRYLYISGVAAAVIVGAASLFTAGTTPTLIGNVRIVQTSSPIDDPGLFLVEVQCDLRHGT
ncbi:hypothetical protein XAB3213_2270001 [Xanthomonas citri pv. bilvae]|nr:hypothetical protein XAB3213_2270001 [Xanthomonas citri pv. bilvae]